MSIRLYVVPMEPTATTPPDFGPKYLSWRADPTPEDRVRETARTVITYGEHDWAVAAVAGAYRFLVTDNPEPGDGEWVEWSGDAISPSDAEVHAALAAKPDVRAFPVDLDTTIASTQERNNIRTYLGGIGLPENWIVVGTPWREIVRTICGTVLFGQRYDGTQLDTVPFGERIQGNLAIQWQNVPTNVQQATVTAGESLGYDMSFITPTTLVRNVLKSLADAWGDRPVLFGLNAYNGDVPYTV